MTDYIVTYETRDPGAIGIFEPRSITVPADTVEGAIGIAGNALRSMGYETRNPLLVNGVDARQAIAAE